jgi:hypothetical protein
VAAGLNPTAGNLLHHAVEMYLKGALAKKGKDLAYLKQFNHRLSDIWTDFKAHHRGDVTEFDAPILELDRFEEIRYPDSILEKGMKSQIGLVNPPAANTANTVQPTYALWLGQVDRLIAKVLQLASINFQAFAPVMPQAKEYLNNQNEIESLKAK